jgi:predicted heme/steroid binding protein/uncharacterized membrane protein
MKLMSPEELAKADGHDGTLSLVAISGNVYDVSASNRWPNGVHMKRHKAGMDLTEEIKAAPHGLEVLQRVHLVGTFQEKQKAPAGGFKGSVETWLDAHPFFRRHPHPAAVHFPLGLLLAAPIFSILGFLTGSEKTEWAGFCCLFLAWLTLPGVFASGYFSWWINYDGKDSGHLKRKRLLAWMVLILATVAVVVRVFLLRYPISANEDYTVTYLLLVVVLACCVSWVGFLGGKLTFPYE